MKQTTHELIITAAVCLTVLGSIFLMTQCEIETSRTDGAIAAQCIESGGAWVPARTLDERSRCDHKERK